MLLYYYNLLNMYITQMKYFLIIVSNTAYSAFFDGLIFVNKYVTKLD